MLHPCVRVSLVLVVAWLSWPANHVARAQAPDPQVAPQKVPATRSPQQTGTPTTEALPAPAVADAEKAAADPADVRAQQLAERAEQLEALMRGRLDAKVDVDTLLAWDFAAGPAPELWLEARKPVKERTTPDTPEAAAFLKALGRYLSLPPAARARVLKRQREKHAAFEAEARLREDLAGELKTLQAGNAKLAAWLAGELDVGQSVAGLLRVDLAWPAVPKLADEEGEALRAEVLAARERRQELLATYARKTPAERAALAARHKERVEAARAEAERAKAPVEDRRRAEVEAEQRSAEAEVQRQREEALEAATRAKSEAQRLYASERARLLGEAQELSRIEAQLQRRAANLRAPRERALAYQRRVQTLTQRAALERNLEPEADRLYQELRSALGRVRADMHEALAAWRSPGSVVPEPEGGPDISLLDGEDQAALDMLRAENQRRRAELRARELQLEQQQARGLNDAMARMNNSRLELLKLASSDLRSALLGFGPEGVEQLQREVDQLVLAATYHLMVFPRDVGRLLEGARTSKYSVVLLLLQLLAALGGFRLWRIRGDDVLKRMEQRARAAPMQTSLMRFMALSTWYLRRIRRPLEWLALLAVVFHLVGRVDALPEIEFLWLACLWVTIGWACVLFLDAMAVRRHLGHRAGYETPELRIRTLRTVALMVVAGGLLLSWTMEGVGQGTVYRWVKVCSSLLATPVALMIAHWWRDPVRLRLMDTASSESPVARWVLRNQEGLSAYAATFVGAVYLFSQGVLRAVMRQAARFEWMQRALAYLFRVQVQRQAQAQAQREGTTKVPLVAATAVRAEAQGPPDELLDEVAQQALADVVEQVLVGSSLTIVVGERGIGRTTFLRRVAERMGEDVVLRVTCPSGEMADLERELKGRAVAHTGVSADGDSVDILAQSPVQVVCVDDVQRMVRPAVGGLDAFERLVDLSQRHDSRIAWVFTITSSAWSVVSRAREMAPGFDRVVRLPSWSEKQIGTLLQRRTEAEGIEPSFEELSVPRQLDVEENMDPVERATLAYYRILWDFSDGNPTVALYFWRQSLFRDAAGRISVSLFETPSPRDIEALPSTLHFMLRAVVQLDRATAQTVADCTAFPLDVVRDGLELAIRRGYVERHDGELSITLRWFRTISTVLRRQHLLVT